MTPGEQLLFALLIVAIVTFASILVLRPIARHTGWVDRPTARKQHHGAIPLVGGVSMLIGLAAGVIFYAGGMTEFEFALFGTACALALIGALDDRFDLSARLRVLLQIAIIVAMIEISGVHVTTLGTYFGHDFALGWLGIPFTVIAVAGLVNAFNMADGLDGLCGCLGIIPVAALMLQGTHALGTMLLAGMLGIGLVPYLVFNLGLLGTRRKIFMGDAGSMTLGYIVAFSLIYASQRGGSGMAPATVLWLVAVPVVDALTVMTARVATGRSPLSPGRGHLHHLLLGKGLGPRKALLVIGVIAIVLAVGGAWLGRVSQTASIIVFIALAVGYAAIRVVMYAGHSRNASAPIIVDRTRGMGPIPAAMALPETADPTHAAFDTAPMASEPAIAMLAANADTLAGTPRHAPL